MTLSCIYEGSSVFYHGRFVTFSRRWVFKCPVMLDPFDPDSQCETWLQATTYDGAFALAVGHSVNCGHSVLLEALCAERVDEGLVELARRVAAKVAS